MGNTEIKSSADSTLQKINYFVTIRESELYMHHYQTILDYVLEEMNASNALFRTLYNGHNLVGSYPDRLKVTRPDEFDVNIRLKFKQDYDFVEVERAPRQPGFCTINLSNCTNIANNNQMRKLLDAEGYLMQDKVNTWMHNIFKNILRKYPKVGDSYILDIDDYSYKVSFSLSGPAYTLKLIVLSSHIKFSVDLAIGFVFDDTKWIAHRKYKRNTPVVEWFAIPKPLKVTGRKNDFSSRAFVCSYACLERKYLYNLNTLKCLIRLFKKLRDTQNFHHLISYHIKTIFLWQIIRSNSTFWDQPLMEVFLVMFEEILEVYNKKRLPSFWDPGHNLLGKLDNAAIVELEDNLRKIYNNILRHEEHNPEYLLKVFLTGGERKEYHRRK